MREVTRSHLITKSVMDAVTAVGVLHRVAVTVSKISTVAGKLGVPRVETDGEPIKVLLDLWL